MTAEPPERAESPSDGVDTAWRCGYSNYTSQPDSAQSVKTPKTVELKIVPIGNSRGVRLPKEIIERYAIEEIIVLEVREEALVFRNKQDKRLSWEDTFKAMAREREDWSDLEGTIADGLDPAERW